MQLTVHGGQGVDVADSVFSADFNEPLVHQIVTAYMAGARAGTKAQKTRADVSGGGAKPWRQKGTGRARAGSSRSPLWRGGGQAFAARPRNFEQKVNRKMYRGAMRSVLSELVRQERLHVVDAIGISEAKTRLLAARLAELSLNRCLIVTEDCDRSLELAARNLPTVAVCTAAEVDPVSLVGSEQILLTVGAVKLLEERFK
ncbi:MAG: 50S ribosomal protein L4 [Chromatiales bacterium]|nr:50S ribosomal protein L4 [Chromatiales bacterium]